MSSLRFTKIRSEDQILNRIQDNISNATITVNSLDATIVPPGTNSITLTNAPAEISGNPTGYLKIVVAGVIRIIPFW